MPSSTVTYPANILARRGALALFGLQATPMVPGTNLSTSNPQKANGNIIDQHTRTLYPDWPEGSVVKTKRDDILQNVLKFRCRPYSGVFQAFKNDTATDAVNIEGAGTSFSPVFNPNNWVNGDGKVYYSVTVYINYYLGMVDHDSDPATPDVAAWDVFTLEGSIGTGGGYIPLTVTNFQNMALAPSTTANPCTDQSLFTAYGPNNGTAYVSYSSEINYGTAASSYMEAPTYSTVTHEFTPRKDGDSAHGLKDYVAVPSGYAIELYDATTLFENGLFTYVLNNSDIPDGVAQRQLVRARWQYTPAAGNCGTCPYAGKTVTIEAKFKQATITRTVSDTPSDPSQQSVSIGTWSDHSTETFTLTLPDSLTAQDLGTDFDFPTSPGKVVALDDLKVVSIS